MNNHIFFFNPYSIPPLLGSLLSLALGFTVFFKDTKSSLHRSFLLFTTPLFLWLFVDGILFSTRNAQLAETLSKCVYIGVAAVPISVLFVCLSLLKIRPPRLLILFCLLAYLTPIYLLFTTDFILKGLHTYFWGYYGKASRYHTYYLFFWSLIYIGSTAFLYFKGLHGKNSYTVKERQRIKYFFSILLMGSIGILDFSQKYGLEIYPCGFLVAPIFCIVTAYAIMKHQILDANVLIRKGLFYSFLVTVFTIVYLCLVIAVKRSFQVGFGYHSLTMSVITASIIAILFIPLRNKIQALIDKIFFGKSPDQIAEENELLKQELLRSEKLKAVAQFASGMAHEIKNPLTAIKTFTEYLPQKKNDQAFLDNFSHIVGQEVERIDGLVRELLDFSKPSPSEFKKLDIHKVIDETLDFLTNQCVKNKIGLRKDYRAKESMISGDSKKLKQVFLNLFMNAIEAMPNGGELSIATDTAQAEDKIAITIGDTGCGIAEKDLPRIFEPFFTTKEKGSGLGLSIAYNIIKEHHGKIRVESAADKGTKFIIELPKN